MLPVMLILFLGALDLGRLFYAKVTVTNAAKEAALVASQAGTFVANSPCNATTNTVMCGATTEAAGGFVTIAPANVTVSPSSNICPRNGTFGSSVTVTVQAPFHAVTPFIGVILGGRDIMLGGTAIAQCAVFPATALATPTPTPVPMCTVPDFVGPPAVKGKNASGVWTNAGFVGGNLTNNVGNNSGTTNQSLAKGTSQPCATATITLN